MGEVFDTTDIGAAEHILRGAYGSVRIGAHGRRGRLRLAQAPLGPSVRFDQVSFSASFNVTASPLGAIAIAHLRSGRVANASDGSERAYRPGDAFLATQPDHPYAARMAEMELEVAHLDPLLVSRVADTAPGRAGQPVRFTGYEPVSRQAAATWKSTYAYLQQLAQELPDAARQPLIAGSASRMLAAAAVAAFPNTALLDPTAQDRHDAHPATVRRAVSFIDDNAHRDISAADIAAAAFVSLRGLQLAFRRHLDCTPTAYLRRVRLACAHRQLAAADPARETVTSVAYQCGFPSPSRFTAYYRQAYGILPSQTLRH